MAETPKDLLRLIEVAFPLKQASLDAVHEKYVRHGHISTVHIWPARRPLAACRSTLLTALLIDPGNQAERLRLLERIGGKIVSKEQTKRSAAKTETIKREETSGGILHWGTEVSPEVDTFRGLARAAYAGRAPRVADPFSGGGAVPLEAMRLGCEVTAIDVNPVAWFLLKCTLQYPQSLSGQSAPLPPFASSQPSSPSQQQPAEKKSKKRAEEPKKVPSQPQLFQRTDADLAGHIVAWGQWILARAKEDLDSYFPVVKNRPTVGYLWARTIECKNCRATVPLLKTRWLCKKDKKRVLLEMAPNRDRSGVHFDVKSGVAVGGGNATQRREHDKRLSQGTMSSSGATCPCCGVVTAMEDIRLEGHAGRIGTTMTAVVVDGLAGKEYRLPTKEEYRASSPPPAEVAKAFAALPFGALVEPINTGSIRKGGVSITRWGFKTWGDVFTSRQQLTLAVFAHTTRLAREEMRRLGYSAQWIEALGAYLSLVFDRLANQCSSVSRWHNKGEKIEGTFSRFALPIMWDFAEVNPLGDTTGGYTSAVTWVALAVSHFMAATRSAPPPTVLCGSAATSAVWPTMMDLIVTDPPYYDAIPYADLMDFFYVWLRRTASGLSPEIDKAFSTPVIPKWDDALQDGELIDDESRFSGDSAKSKAAYEDGMSRVFQQCSAHLEPDGRLVIVFANKQPDAWETLVSAMIRAGFVVNGSWPIQTEMGTRTRALTSAALSSSVWLVCKKRPESARPGWDNQVLDEMRRKIHSRLREFWDAGIRGPDFVWAGTGPALEAYSSHPVVKKANEPGALLGVSEFLRHVRRIVVDFVVGRVLTRDGGDASVSGLDDVTTYYLLHRNDFSFADAPAGACILYAVSCGLSDHDLTDNADLLVKTGSKAGGAERSDDEDDVSSDGESDETPGEGSGNKMKLRGWEQRKRKGMGYDAEGRPAPLIDQIHRLMHLWKAGDVNKVEEYLDARALRKNQLFHKLLQALIELAEAGGDERSLLESISNHVASRPAREDRQRDMFQS